MDRLLRNSWFKTSNLMKVFVGHQVLTSWMIKWYVSVIRSCRIKQITIIFFYNRWCRILRKPLRRWLWEWWWRRRRGGRDSNIKHDHQQFLLPEIYTKKLFLFHLICSHWVSKRGQWRLRFQQSRWLCGIHSRESEVYADCSLARRTQEEDKCSIHCSQETKRS